MELLSDKLIRNAFTILLAIQQGSRKQKENIVEKVSMR
ncbi:hypothetical protein BN8_00345 [Fibrisoma limi BUZ 3]|uniref:Uncharacterized protein n=1 Tax=Fibrisoma limi BUZ 3 TaxID=1185876 RepID=I2GBZ8_9BACT|nr:hypothetical protein BN8_00345 [Fibrisoma limi BUZ 3]